VDQPLTSQQPEREAARAVSVAQMQQIDAAAVERIGIPRLLLMEHAGLAVARAVRHIASDPSTPVVICCGSGFNGGDGLAAARHLFEWGYPLRLLLVGARQRLRGEPQTYAAILARLGLDLLEWPAMGAAQDGQPPSHEPLESLAQWVRPRGMLVDALLGIGTRGAVREPLATLIRWMNGVGRPIVAVDLPSGLDGDTGRAQGVAVRATLTVTFGLPKQGCFREDGPDCVGSLIVDSISLPGQALVAA
jgi:NAD(P)H-hydrate epimerase